MKIIGLKGGKGVGKDTAANALSAIGFANIKMAAPLKAMLMALLKTQGIHSFDARNMIEGDMKEEPSPYLGGRSPRYAMQTLGTEWGRNLMADSFWTDIVKNQILNYGEPVVVSDVRFPNEAAMLKSIGGIIVEITRPSHVAGDGHISENLLDSIHADYIVTNDKASALEFQVHFMETIGDEIF